MKPTKTEKEFPRLAWAIRVTNIWARKVERALNPTIRVIITPASKSTK